MLQRLLGPGLDGSLRKLGFAGACIPDERETSCCAVVREGEFVNKTVIDDRDEGVKVMTSPGGTKGIIVQPDALQPKPGFGQLRFQVARGEKVDATALSGRHSVDLWTKAHYQGQFHDGKFHGEGVYQFSDGRLYEGHFDKGNISGKGTFFWPVQSGPSRPTSPSSSVGSAQPLSPDLNCEYAVFEGIFLDNEPVEGTLFLPGDTGFKGKVKEVFGKRQGLMRPPHYSPRTSFASNGTNGTTPQKRMPTRRSNGSTTYGPRSSMMEFFANGMNFDLPSQKTRETDSEVKPRPSLRI